MCRITGQNLALLLLMILCLHGETFFASAETIHIDIDAAPSVPELTVEEFYEMQLAGQVDLIIDVRGYTEFLQGHIENATLVRNMGHLLSILAPRDVNETLKNMGIFPCMHSCVTVVYCRRGFASAEVIRQLRNKGWSSATLYNGQDINTWKAAGLPVVTTPESYKPPCSSYENLDDPSTFTCPSKPRIEDDAGTHGNSSDTTNTTATSPAPGTSTPSQPTQQPAISVVQKDPAEVAKCGGSLANSNENMGGSAGTAKDCSRNTGGGRRLKGRR